MEDRKFPKTMNRDMLKLIGMAGVAIMLIFLSVVKVASYFE